MEFCSPDTIFRSRSHRHNIYVSVYGIYVALLGPFPVTPCDVGPKVMPDKHRSHVLTKQGDRCGFLTAPPPPPQTFLSISLQCSLLEAAWLHSGLLDIHMPRKKSRSGEMGGGGGGVGPGQWSFPVCHIPIFDYLSLFCCTFCWAPPLFFLNIQIL